MAIRLTQLYDDISQSKAIILMYNAHRCMKAEIHNLCIKGVQSGYVKWSILTHILMYDGWNFNSGNYLFTTDTK